ncbi:MAG: 4Fe-4S dicluster domain-containing protein [Eubacteriales bacterium]|nr:4Fe-4S dicluster domain-containing protein [Eubacteriales bacterium]
MNFEELQKKIREGGVVGSGGAGFPSYAKLNKDADTILLNCAECEPLLQPHKQLITVHTEEVLEGLHMVAEAVGAKQVIIGIKKAYKQAIEAIEAVIGRYPEIRMHFLQEVYPMGDEVVMIYECTGRVVRPGGLPIEQGCIVYNVETMYNIYRAATADKPVTFKYLTVIGEVSDPITVAVPLGTTFREAVALAGEVTCKDPVYFVGGPMMGRILPPDGQITKTTNAILVLPQDHVLVMKKRRTTKIDLARAASICCQCETCTNMCPRHALGHPIDPAKFMRSASNADFQDLNPFLNTNFCSGCGVCELYACPQDLAPRTLIGEYKAGLRQKGIRPPKVDAVPIQESREYRKVPEERLMARLGLTRYDRPAPLKDEVQPVSAVTIALSQHIGAPAVPIVKIGDTVEYRQMIAKPADGLSVGIHASLAGVVTNVTDKFVRIEKR